MYDFYFELTDQHIKNLNMLSLYHRISENMKFTMDSPLKLLIEQGKIESFFSNSSMMNFLPRTRVLQLKEGAIEKMV